MARVDYDRIAPAYDRRYQAHRFDGIDETVRDFVLARPRAEVALEVGCGTGHWLATLAELVPRVLGIDRSLGMLATVRGKDPAAKLVQATAEHLPIADGSVDRVVCINALHHFGDRPAFVREARRALRPGGALLIIGLDPHDDGGKWWIYDTFPSARRLDRERYPSSAAIRSLLESAGFTDPRTTTAERIDERLSFADALARGLLDRRSTSQLMVIDDAEWETGLRDLHARRPELYGDLRLYATSAWVAERSGQ